MIHLYIDFLFGRPNLTESWVLSLHDSERGAGNDHLPTCQRANEQNGIIDWALIRYPQGLASEGYASFPSARDFMFLVSSQAMVVS